MYIKLHMQLPESCKKKHRNEKKKKIAGNNSCNGKSQIIIKTKPNFVTCQP